VISHPFTGSDILAFRVFFAHVLLGLLATSAWAEVRYIDDTLLVPLRRGESSQHRIIHRGLPSGTKLELLGENTETGYAHVRTPGGTEGYVPVQYLRKTPIARDQLAEAQKTIAALTSKSKPVQAQLLELFDEKSPKTVENFLAYVDSKFYDNTIFHRVIPRFMIQGGGLTEDMQEKPTRAPVINESKNRVHNERGTIAMARTSDPDSATAQWYINVRMNITLDYRMGTPGYTVFGKVTKGMDVVDTISVVKTQDFIVHQDVPVEPVIIKSVRRLP
jgi:cyclophilin family peptidyl-prolyl cis-trans isomerase